MGPLGPSGPLPLMVFHKALFWDLNSLKTKFIWLGTRQKLAKLDMATLAAEFPHFIFSSVVRDLGVFMDQELTFAPHLNLLILACYYQLRQLRTVARSLTPTAILPLSSTVSSLPASTI